MTQRRALGDLDFDSAFDDLDNGWFGYVPAVDPTSSREHEDPADPPPEADWYDAGGVSTEDTDRWPVVTLDAATAPQVDDEARTYYEPKTYEPKTYEPNTYERETYERETYEPREAAPQVPPSIQPRASSWAEAPPATSPSWESRLSGSGAWDFKVSESGTRKRSSMAVVGLIVVGLAVAGAVLLVRSTGPADDGSTSVAPSRPTAQPAPTSATPALSTPNQAPLPSPAPLPPGLPPPPPPPSAQEISPPVVTRDYTPRQQNAPDESAEPEIGVTRSPTTRTQMSAKPPPPRKEPNRDSRTPGDTRGGFGFGGF